MIVLSFYRIASYQPLIYIPAIVIAELYYLNEKKGRPLDFRTKYARLAQSKQFVLLPFYPSHTLDFDACSAVTEMHDLGLVEYESKLYLSRYNEQ